MAGPGVYERRRFQRERERLAEQLSDMPWERDPYTGRVTGALPGETDVPRTPEDVERWQRFAARAERTGRNAPAVAPDVTATGAARPRLWPAPPGQYARWTSRGRNVQYRNWPGWYAPKGAVEEQPHLRVINELLPYMGADDAELLARQLYIGGGGEEGPFGGYLAAATRRSPVYGGPRRPGIEPQPPGTAVPTTPPERFWEIRDRYREERERRQGMPTRFPGAAKPPKPPRKGTRGTYENTLVAIEKVIDRIPDATAKAWARSVFDIYRDYTPRKGMRQSEDESVLQAQLEELFASIPESAQAYAAAMQRLVQPTVRRPEREWYELPARRRTSPTNWSVAGGLLSNPAWM